MTLDYYKELTPVFYHSDGLKILCVANIPPDKMVFPMHWHDRMELILVTSGSLNIRVGTETTTLSPNHLAIISPRQLHYGLSGAEGVSCYAFMFDISHFMNSVPTVRQFIAPISEKRTLFQPWTSQHEIVELLKNIIKLHTSKQNFHHLQVVGKIYELVALLYQFCFTGEEVNSITDSRFQDVLNYVNLHFAENISSEGLSRKFGYSQGYFCRHFKEITGLSPMIYIRILRLEKAENLIREHNLSLKEIALQCCFSDMSYFTKCFKAHFQLTPTEYMEKIP